MGVASSQAAKGVPFWSRLGLRTWAILLLVLGVLLIAGGVGIMAESAQRRGVDEVLRDRLHSAQAEADYLDELLERQWLRVDAAATSSYLNLEDGDLGFGKQMLPHFFPSGLYPVYSVLIVDRSGQVLWSEPYLPRMVGTSVAAESYFREARRTGDHLIYPKAVVTADDRLVLPIIAPLRNTAGVATGFLVELVDLSHDRLLRHLSELAPGETGYVQLVDGGGIVIVSTKPQKVGKPMAEWDAVRALAPEGGTTIAAEQEEGKQETHILALAPLSHVPWFLAIEQDQEEAFAAVNALRWRIVLFTLLALVLAGVPTYAVVRWALRAVGSLNTAAGRIARGDLATPVPLGGPGEVRTLGIAAEAMRQQLQGSFTELERRNRELAALFAIEAAVAAGTDIGELFAAVVTEIVTTLDADVVGIFRRIDDENVELLAQRGVKEELLAIIQRMKADESAVGLAMQLHQLVEIDTVQSPNDRLLAALKAQGIQRLASAPMALNGEVLGAMTVGRRIGRPFAADDLALMGVVAKQLGVAFHRLELRAALERRNRELSALFAIEAAAAESATLADLFPVALREITSAVEADTGGIYLCVDDADLELAAYQGLTRESAEAMKRVGRDEGISGQAIQSRHPIALDISQYPTQRLVPVVAQEGIQCISSAPLVANDEVLGVINLGRRTPRPFSASDLAMLGAVASQLAQAYRRVELRDVLERRSEIRATLNRITAAITGYLDLNEIFQALSQELQMVLPYDRLGLALWDENSGNLVLVSLSGAASTRVGAGTPIASPGSKPGQAFWERRTLVVGDLEVEKSHPQDEEILAMGVRSGVFIPLEAKGRVLGALTVGSKETYRFGPEELQLLEPVAHQLALAIENARLYQLTDEKLRHRVADLETLAGVLQAASQGLALDKILSDVLQLAVYALGVDRAGVMLLDETGQKATVAAAFGRHGEGHPGLGMSLDITNLPMLTKVLADEEPLVIEDIQSLPGDHQRRLAEEGGVRSVLLVSMLLRGKPVGTLQFTTTAQPKSYTPEEIALAQAIADQLAVAIENARLFTQVDEERSTLDAIGQSMGDGLLVVGADRRVIYCNKAVKNVISIGEEAVLGQPLEVFQNLLYPQVREPESLVERWGKAIAHREELPTVEFVVLNGNPRDVVATIFPVRTAQGVELGTGVLLRDVTQERAADRLKSEFVALASHELRTPLTGIYGYAELLLTRRVNEDEQRRWLEIIHDEAGSLADIVDDFLNLSRIEAGRLPINPRPLELPPFIEETLARLRPQNPRHSFTLSLPDALPPVMADPSRLQEVFHNLLGNAIKYSPRGGRIGVAVALNAPAGYIRISISDEGVGVAPEDMPKLFGRFFRVLRAETENVRGTGLGLHMAKALVEGMGGAIGAESQLNEGSTFYFTLPLAGAAERDGEE